MEVPDRGMGRLVDGVDGHRSVAVAKECPAWHRADGMDAATAPLQEGAVTSGDARGNRASGIASTQGLVGRPESRQHDGRLQSGDIETMAECLKVAASAGRKACWADRPGAFVSHRHNCVVGSHDRPIFCRGQP